MNWLNEAVEEWGVFPDIIVGVLGSFQTCLFGYLSESSVWGLAYLTDYE